MEEERDNIMDFSQALIELKDGKTISRAAWAEDEFTLSLVNGTITIKVGRRKTPWSADNESLLADDWNTS